MWQSGIVAKWRLSENRAKLACALPSVCHFDVSEWRILKGREIRNLLWEIADAERLISSCSDCEWAVALSIGLFQSLPSTVVVAERLVQQHQVEVVGLQLAQTLVDTRFVFHIFPFRTYSTNIQLFFL